MHFLRYSRISFRNHKKMPTQIRSSMLPAYFDCARRAAAKQFTKTIQSAGFQLRETSPSVGSSFGTAAHSGLEFMLRHKMENLVTGSAEAALEVALGKLGEEAKDGLEWDDTTPNISTAALQMRRVMDECANLAERINPVRVEWELCANLGDDFELTGHVDYFTKEGIVRDFKSGALHRPYQAQLGAYALLAKANGEEVKGVAIDWIARQPKSKPQTPVEVETYPISTCEKAAWSTIQRIKRDVLAFKDSGDPFEFPANPMTMMCSDRFCSAHGTSFCTMHLKSNKE